MFSILALISFAQENQYQINGRVVDSQTKEPIALATVKCNNIAVAANEKGVFSFSKLFAKGKYKVVVVNVGFDGSNFQFLQLGYSFFKLNFNSYIFVYKFYNCFFCSKANIYNYYFVFAFSK